MILTFDLSSTLMVGAQDNKSVVGRAGFEPATSSAGQKPNLRDFYNFLIDCENKRKITATQYRRLLERFFESEREISRESIMRFLSELRDKRATKANFLKALFRLCKGYLGRPDLVAGLRIPRVGDELKEAPSDEDVRRAYSLLTDVREKAVYLMYATGGMRRTELLEADLEDLDLENRTLRLNHISESKKAGTAIFNEECAEALEQWVNVRDQKYRWRKSPRLFTIDSNAYKRMWRKIKAGGLEITPKVLRLWHATKLGELGVPDRYVNVLQGRAPVTVLQKHYTGTELKRLRLIYDKAGLRVLC